MLKRNTAGLILSVSIAAAQLGIVTVASAADANRLRAISETTATGFAFPEYIPEGKGYLVVAPDLVKGELRLIRLGN